MQKPGAVATAGGGGGGQGQCPPHSGPGPVPPRPASLEGRAATVGPGAWASDRRGFAGLALAPRLPGRRGGGC